MLGIKTAALPASLRRTNQRTVISLLLRMGCASRADLAKAAGISQPTAGKITAELLEMGVLQSAEFPDGNEGASGHGGASRRLGRPGQLLRLDAERPRFLAIELGVMQTRVAALPVAIRSADEWAHEFSTPATAEAWVAGLREVAAAISHRGLWGVLISVPGIVDEAKDRVIFSPNLHWLESAPLAQLVKGVWDLPVALVQEIRALALGHLASEPVREDFFLADFGQGVGGAVVIDGQLYPQPTPLSGEFGHTPVPGNLRPCGCGATGCLETLVSRRGLLQSFGVAQGRRPGAAPEHRSRDGEQAETTGQTEGWAQMPAWKRLLAHVEQRGVEPWLGETLDTAAKVICGGLNVLGLHRVVITGSLTEFPGCVIDRLTQEVQRGALWARFGAVTCQAAVRRRSSGLVAMGIDRLILPAEDETGGLLSALSGTPAPRRNLAPV